jgi:predicted phage tail protein
LFQRENKIFFDGVLEDVQNIRSFIYENAALHLCNFTIKNGRFGLMPAVPYEASGKISTQPIAVEQIFTAGNIIADSLQVNYIDAAQRTNFRAVVMWRVTTENDLPTQASAFLNWSDLPDGERATTQQTFDLTDFCTNREQALLTARFLMSVRRRVTHTISFKTTPAGLAIEPGSYIRVITESTSYSASNNGVITDAGTLVSISTIENGTYTALVYNPSTSEVTEQQLTISGGSVSDSSLYGTIFTLLSTEVSKGVYQIDQITIDEDGLANISAVHVPVDAAGASIVVQDILTPARFIVAE